MSVVAENLFGSKSKTKEFPRLTSALRRLGGLTQPNFDDTKACCSIESKRAFLAGAAFEDYYSLKVESLWGQLSSLVPPTVTLERKTALERLMHQYTDSCVDLVGRDASGVNVYSSHATLLCFGELGPKVIDLLSRGVSPPDLSRHHSVQKLKELILSKLGGTGAQNPGEVWNRIFSNLGSLLSHPLLTGFTQDLLDIMRRCRLAEDSDENSASNAVLGCKTSIDHQKAIAHRRRLALKSLDWDSAKIAKEELRRIADKILEVLSGPVNEVVDDANLSDADKTSASHRGPFSETDALR